MYSVIPITAVAIRTLAGFNPGIKGPIELWAGGPQYFKLLSGRP